MGHVQARSENSDKTTFQARVRRKGFPALSKNFPTESEAKLLTREQN